MHWTTSSELNKLIREKLQQGWTIDRGRKHLKLRCPQGGLVSMSISPSCRHASNQVRRDIRRLEAVNANKKRTV